MVNNLIKTCLAVGAGAAAGATGGVIHMRLHML